MKTKEYKHPSVIRLIENVINEIPIERTGIYNKADPTYYEVGSMPLVYKNVFFTIGYNNCTWGVELQVSFKNGFGSRTFFEMYLSRRFGQNDPTTVISRETTDLPHRSRIIMLARAFKHTFHPDFVSYKQKQWEMKSEMEDDPVGRLSDYI